MQKFYHWSILIITILALLPAGLYAQERNASNSNSGANEHSQIARETHVTANEARAIGLRFLNANTGQTRGANELQMATAYRTAQGDTAFYVFNTANGFVMVAADRCAMPVLGYSDEGAFDVNHVPIQMQSYLQGFVEQIAYGIGHPTAVDATTAQQWDQVRTTGQLTTSSANVARGNNLVNTAMENNRMTKSVMMAKDSAGKMVRKEVSLSDLMNGTAENSHIMMPTLPKNNRGSRSGSNGVAPLITANWDQGCYYNAQCPSDTDGICGHVPTGCVATAMGMIMRYWGYPAQGTGTHSYTPDGYPEQTVNFGTTTYDWDNMPDQLDENSTQAQIDAVSTLLWHCGVAVEMVYGAYTSSALDGSIPAAFHDYYGYCTPYYQYKEDNASWLELVKSSIDRQRPLLYFATDATGLGGHAFVCDGYNAADQLHFNWGWGGNGNGYFAVDALNVDVFQFNNDVHALFGIMPQSEFQLRYNIIEGGVEVTYEQPELGTPAYYTYPDTIVIPSQVTIDGTTYPVIAIGDKAFQCCWNLKSVIMPNIIKPIGKYAFYSCSNMSHIIMSDSVTLIDDYSFLGSGITSLDLPNTLNTIGIQAFSFCGYWPSVTIPRSVTSVGNAIFLFTCLDTVNWNVDSCVMYLPEGSTGYWTTFPCAVLNIGEHVKHISSWVFSGCPCDTIIIPDSVISIKDQAFVSSGMKFLSLGNSITTIGWSAFESCGNLDSIYIPKQVRDVGLGSFSNCGALTTVFFNATNCVGANQSFNWDTNLNQVLIGDSVTNIPPLMFANCLGLKSVTIPNAISRIECSAFYNCKNLDTIYMQASIPPVLVYQMDDGGFCDGNWTFDNSEDRVFIIPCESYEAYYSDAGWETYRSALRGIPEIDILLNVEIEDSIRGTVQVIRYPNVCDSTIIYYAKANHGYRFDHWSNGRSFNPDTMFLTNDTTIIAFFVKDQFEVSGGSSILTYYTDFENVSDDTTWFFKSGEYENKWYINYLDSNNRALFISNNEGLTNSCSSTPSFVFAYLPIYFTAGYYTYAYKWRDDGLGALSSDEIQSALIPYSLESEYIERVWSGYIWYFPEYLGRSIGGSLKNQSSWQTEFGDVYVDFDSTYNLVFYWWLSTPGEDYFNEYPAAVDNIIIGKKNPECGYVIGVENVDYLDTVSITAVPNPGYRFVCWYDCDTNITKQVVVTGDLTCVAYFDAEHYSVVVNSSDTLSGTVSGGGIFGYSEECTIIATPAEGYHFFRWSDGNTNNPRTITVTQDTSFTAIFAACANTSTVESVSANESYLWADSLYTASGIYEHTWTTAEGCDSTVSLWLTITKTQYDTTYIEVHDSIYVDVHDTTYLWQYDTTYVNVPYPVHDTTYVDIHDTTYVTLTDTVVLNHYDTTYVTVHDTITVTEQLTWYSLQMLSADLDKGVAAGSGQFPEGTDVEIAAVPIEGNRFLQWSDGSEANPRTVTVDGDLTLTALFTTVGVADLVLPTWYVYPEQGAFVVKGAGGHQVSVYDAAGKLLHRYPNAPDILRYSVPASGSYLIQVDNGAAKKVPVVR